MYFDIVISSPLLRTTHTEYILTNYDDSIITDERLRKIVMKKDKGYKALFIENIDNNRIFVPFPEINKKSESNKINFHVSNPYNKFDSSIEDDNKYYFYLLINFPNIKKYPIYVNVKYIYNKNI